MPRLTHSTGNTAAPNASVANTPQTTQPVASGVRSEAAATIKSVRRRRRYPLWLLPVLLIAVGVSGTELWLHETRRAHTRALDTAQISLTKYMLKLPIQNAAHYVVAPAGDKFAIRYTSNRNSYVEVRRFSGKLLWKAEMNYGDIAFSQDGALLLHGRDALQAETGKLLARAPVGKYQSDISWDTEGQRAALGNHTSVQVWDKATNKMRSLAIPFPLGSPSGTYSYCTGTRISADGKWVTTMIASGRPEESCVLLWNLETSGKPRVLPVYQVGGSVFGLAFSPDSKSLLYSGGIANGKMGSEENWTVVWAVNTGQAVFSIRPPQKGLIATWSPDCQYAAVRDFEGWRLYQVATGKLVWQAPRQEKSFYNSMTFTADNRLYFNDDDRKKGEWPLKYWDLARVLNKQGKTE